LVFFAATTFSLQLGRPQDKIHASVSDVPWHNNLSRQICITASRKTESRYGTSWEVSCSGDRRS
jgi:hypothetical protein